MRRAGHNPTDVEVTDIINKIDSDTGNIDFQVILEFVLYNKTGFSMNLTFTTQNNEKFTNFPQ